MTHTAEEVQKVAVRVGELSLAVAKGLKNEFTMRVPAEPDRDADLVLQKAEAMLTAYADLLERSPVVTPEVVQKALSVFFRAPESFSKKWLAEATWMLQALEAVWPVAADSKPSVQEEMSRKDAVINLIAAIWSIDSLRNRCRSDIDALREWLNREPSAEPAQAAHFDKRRFEEAPCYLCGYNGPGYYRPNIHPCAKQYHTPTAAQGQPATPILNIRCESVAPDGVKGSTYLPVVRVEAEDDGSFTAVTNYWPAEPAQDNYQCMSCMAKDYGLQPTAEPAQPCTCPSGDGSLRWPCPVHPPAERVPEVVTEVLAELDRAMRKFPTWPTDPLHALAVLGEEYGELNKAVLQQVYEPAKNPLGAVHSEAVQAAAMALRFIASIDEYAWLRSVQHEQPILAAPSAPKGE